MTIISYFCIMKRVKPKKNLGQHFLTDLNIAKRIADTVDACPDIPVLEIGPGMGVLTQYLIPKPREVKVVEIDRESVAYLKERWSDGKVSPPNPLSKGQEWKPTGKWERRGWKGLDYFRRFPAYGPERSVWW